MPAPPQTEDATLTMIEKDKNIRKLKRQTEGWREIIIVIRSVLLWEADWHPPTLVGLCSVISFIFWKLDPSFLSTVSIVGLVMVTLDTLVPLMSSKIYDQAEWTGVKEKQFEDCCKTVIEYKMLLGQYWTCLQGMRETQPKMYYSTVIPMLCFLIWIGNCNTHLLSYFIIITAVMMPGLIHHGYLQKHYRSILLALKSTIDNSINRKAKKN
ncbi:ADP-ribosylation factor-like protein 6-interacting protein 1 [Nilaparvata lugens]|uniref:ADP-ribosylation factor-like protein 6-interacting protein 1 n=1 Tax=Nilaparvata lugens TaxID=108931 RepID=UPI00193E3521|nr:ADP-ribosylation factor-like protein 6-interacting protein 1 [Nilaparvata lugens]